MSLGWSLQAKRPLLGFIWYCPPYYMKGFLPYLFQLVVRMVPTYWYTNVDRPKPSHLYSVCQTIKKAILALGHRNLLSP